LKLVRGLVVRVRLLRGAHDLVVVHDIKQSFDHLLAPAVAGQHFLGSLEGIPMVSSGLPMTQLH
jgi:hypothetical protein